MPISASLAFGHKQFDVRIMQHLRQLFVRHFQTAEPQPLRACAAKQRTIPIEVGILDSTQLELHSMKRQPAQDVRASRDRSRWKRFFRERVRCIRQESLGGGWSFAVRVRRSLLLMLIVAKCSLRTSFAVKIEMNGAGAAAFSTLGRPWASSRSTRHIAPTTLKPNSRAASMACTVEEPVVQTSSTITTRAPFSRKPSMRCPVRAASRPCGRGSRAGFRW